tara:strand:+ start:311 stop:1438 length:1128 start_codon:yes stop_codon:yes gene_type:complete
MHFGQLCSKLILAKTSLDFSGCDLNNLNGSDQFYWDSQTDHIMNSVVKKWCVSLDESFRSIHLSSFLEAATSLPIHNKLSVFDIDFASDLIYFKLNHGFWELNSLFFSDIARSACDLVSRPFLQDYKVQVSNRFLKNGFLSVLSLLCSDICASQALISDKKNCQKKIYFGVSIWDGIFSHQVILDKLSLNTERTSSNMINMAYNSTCAISSWLSMFSHEIHFAEGCLPKKSMKDGSLNDFINQLDHDSVQTLAIVPNHLDGLVFKNNSNVEIKKIIISGDSVHSQWPSLIHACTILISNILESGKNCLVLVQAGSVSALLAIYLYSMLDTLDPVRGKLVFLDLGQAIDASHGSKRQGKWLSRPEYKDSNSPFLII